MNDKEKELLIQKLQTFAVQNRAILKKVKTDKILYHYHFHIASGIDEQIKLIKNQ